MSEAREYTLEDLLALHNCGTVGHLNAYIGGLEGQAQELEREVELLERRLITIQVIALTEDYRLFPPRRGDPRYRGAPPKGEPKNE